METDHWQSGPPHGPDRAGPAVPTVERARIEAGQLRGLRIAALAEATTLLLLVGVAAPLKHLGDWPAAVRVLGPVHGFAFVAYLWLLLQTLGAGLLSRGEAARLGLAAFVPVLGFFTARSLALRIAPPLDRGMRG